jgi:hypothetical protein
MSVSYGDVHQGSAIEPTCRSVLLVACVIAVLGSLAACGGGDSGAATGGPSAGSGSPGGSNPPPTPTPTPAPTVTADIAAFSITQGPTDQPTEFKVNLTISNLTGYWYRYRFQGPAIRAVSDAWPQLIVALWPPPLMGSGSYHDQLTIEFCTDAQCNNVLTALSKVIPVDHVVTGTTPSIVTYIVTPSASLVAEAVDTASSATVQVQVYANELPPYTTYLTGRVQGTGAVADGSWASVSTGGYQANLTLNLTNPSTIGPGRYVDVLTLTICYDRACTKPARGSPWTLPIRYTVTATAVTDFSERMASVRASDLRWSQARSMLYAVTPSYAAQNPSTLVEVDPLTAQVTRSLVVGGSPNALSVTEDGLYAYVGFSDVGQVKRIALNSMTLDLAIPLPVDPTYGTTYAGYLLPLPGASTSVVVSSYVFGTGLTDWDSRGVYIYDGATARPQTFLAPDAFTQVMGLAWAADNTTLYAYDQNQQRLFAATTSTSGLTLANQKTGVVMSPAMYQVNGLLYSNNGIVIDPATGTRGPLFLDSSGASPAGLIAPDAATGRAYFYYLETLTPAPLWTFATYNLQAQTFIASSRVNGCSLFPGGVNNTVGRMVRWGIDGLAVNCIEGIKIINGKFVKP